MAAANALVDVGRAPPERPDHPPAHLVRQPGADLLGPLEGTRPHTLRFGAAPEPALEVAHELEGPHGSLLVADALELGEGPLGRPQRAAHRQVRRVQDPDFDLGEQQTSQHTVVAGGAGGRSCIL